jgi:hypothetical protein
LTKIWINIRLATFASLTLLATISDDSLAQDLTCDASILDAATTQHEGGLFDDSSNELKACLPDGFSQKEQRVSAYRLLALNYIVTDSLDQAHESIRQLLKTDSGYEPDLETDPPLFADMVYDMKPAWYTFMWKGNSASRWIGRAAVVGAVVAVPLLLKDNSAAPLPDPPGLPSTAGQ